VISAVDSVKHQTKEVITLAKKYDIPIVVAINMIDREGSDPDQVIIDLEKFDVKCESIGGEIPCVSISALKKLNLK
jgi:translation initiation factor IF-2